MRRLAPKTHSVRAALCSPPRLPLPPDFELIDDRRAGKIVVELNGRINKCGCISPRYDIQHQEIEAWVGRVLPSRLFGVLILTTSNGIMDHEEARKKKVGGKVLGFVY